MSEVGKKSVPCAYFGEGNECKESYFEHIYCMIKVWEAVRPYYVKALRRATGVRDPDRLMRLSFLAHDAGKLLEAYRTNKSKFRHELIGAYVAYKLIETEAERAKDDKERDAISKAAYLFSTAVLLHHESIILSVYAGEYGERFIPLSTIRKVLEEFRDKLRPYAKLRDDRALKLLGMEKDVERMEHLVDSLNADEVYNVIVSLVTRASEESDALVFRNRVATVQHALVLVDSVAANSHRGGGSDEGTWITRMAEKGAELPKEVKCNA